MRVKTLILGAGAALATAAPIMAQAANAGRAAAPVDGESALGYPEGPSQLVVLLLIAAAIVAGAAIFGGDDEPASP